MERLGDFQDLIMDCFRMLRHEFTRSMRGTRGIEITRRQGGTSSTSTRSWPTSRSWFTTTTRPVWRPGSQHTVQLITSWRPSSHSTLFHSCLWCHKNYRCFILSTSNSSNIEKRGLFCNTTKHQKLKYLQNAKRHYNHSFLIPMAFLWNLRSNLIS